VACLTRSLEVRSLPGVWIWLRSQSSVGEKSAVAKAEAMLWSSIAVLKSCAEMILPRV